MGDVLTDLLGVAIWVLALILGAAFLGALLAKILAGLFPG